MTIYTINNDNNISTFSSEEEVANYPEIEHFSRAEELAELAAHWPAARLVEIWNCLPGTTQLKKFTDRPTAVSRIWRAIQQLADPVTSEPAIEGAENVTVIDPENQDGPVTADEPEVPMPESEQEPNVAPEAADVAMAANAPSDEPTSPEQAPVNAPQAKSVREGSKTAIVLELLKREGGATLQQLMDATGWQKHSIRGFLSGTVGKKLGLTVVSTKSEAGERTYSIPA